MNLIKGFTRIITNVYVNIIVLCLILGLAVSARKRESRKILSENASSKLLLEPPPIGNVTVHVLGEYGIPPWQAFSGFADPKAKWIWDAEKSPRINVSQVIKNETSEKLLVRMHVCVSDNAIIVLNGTIVSHASGWGASYAQFPIELMMGWNQISIIAQSFSEIPGLLVALLDEKDNKVLLRSDENWKIQR